MSIYLTTYYSSYVETVNHANLPASDVVQTVEPGHTCSVQTVLPSPLHTHSSEQPSPSHVSPGAL